MALGITGCGPAPRSPAKPANRGPAPDAANSSPPLACRSKRDDHAFVVSAERAAVRRGATDEYFSDRQSTDGAPVEVCGYAQQYAWLARVACDDGSRPVADRTTTEATRVAAMLLLPGEDEPCSLIVDHWQIPCPERTYGVAINQYVCRADEGVWDNWSRR